MDILVPKIHQKDAEQDLVEAFKVLDADNSGSIDASEFMFVMKNISSDFTDDELKLMIKDADVDGDGTISQSEFVRVMGKRKGNKSFKSDALNEMRTQLKRFLDKKKIEKEFKTLPAYVIRNLDMCKEKVADYKKNFKEKVGVYGEDFENAKLMSLYGEVWDIFQLLMLREHEAEKKEKRLKQEYKTLTKTYKTLKDQQEEGGFEEPGEDADSQDIDFRKIYKTIMCPLGKDCPRCKTLRWPYSNIKSHQKFGKDCPYAHHSMELRFPETL